VPETEPRYVLTFKPGSPEMIVVSLLALVGGGIAVLVSWVLRALICGEVLDNSSDSCRGGTALLVVALVGLAPVVGMVVESARRRGHPWYWFFAGVFVYGFWAVVFLSYIG
jgi:hypothetical protein